MVLKWVCPLFTVEYQIGYHKVYIFFTLILDKNQLTTVTIYIKPLIPHVRKVGFFSTLIYVVVNGYQVIPKFAQPI